jgi:hypothetical protein
MVIAKNGGKPMRSVVVLLGMLLVATSSAKASIFVCRGSISQEWGYLTITTEEGIECIVTRRVGMQTVINACGDKRCKVTGVISDEQPLSLYQYIQQPHQYIDGLITVEIDPLQWGTLEPKRLGDPTLSE